MPQMLGLAPCLKNISHCDHILVHTKGYGLEHVKQTLNIKEESTKNYKDMLPNFTNHVM